MHQLILMRHAKAERAQADQPDYARALSPDGRAAATRLRTTMKALGIEPDVILVSAAARTRQTLECVAFWDDRPIIDYLDLLYMAPASRIEATVAGLRETMRSVMLIGHNPGIQELADALASGARDPTPPHRTLAEGFPTARLAEFLILTPWRDLRPAGARLQRVIDPPR